MERDRGRQRQRETERETDRERDRERQTERQKERWREIGITVGCDDESYGLMQERCVTKLSLSSPSPGRAAAGETSNYLLYLRIAAPQSQRAS